MKTINTSGLIEAFNGEARNSMHSILGFLELVREGPLTPAQGDHIEACRTAADRHFRSVEDVRTILGVVSEERPVVTNFVPSDLFGQVADVVGLITGRKGMGLFCNIDKSVPPMVAGDVDRLAHVLLRLSGAVVSAVEGADVYFSLRAHPTAHGINLTFEMAMPTTVLSPVLMRALQDDDFEFDGTQSGSGALGLAAARTLAVALEGSIQASADSTTGTRIAVTFAVKPPLGLSPTQPGIDSPQENQQGLRILVAEDSEDSFGLFKAFLSGQPHIVARANNGAEAVALAATGAFDLVFMDICMPIMDGYAATRRIRELETGKDRARMPIVVLSAEDLRAQRRQGALVGCSGHLSKPLRKHELLEAIGTYSARQASLSARPRPVV
jgi:CheY-like chemotaxis protein